MLRQISRNVARPIDALRLAAPLVAVTLAALLWSASIPAWALAPLTLVLAGAVMSAVHDAEVIAERVGEPFGSLVLAVSVTAIEVGMVVVLMNSGRADADALARDTVYAALVITTTGILGGSLLVASIGRGEVHFNAEGSVAALATLTVLGTITLVVPRFTESAASAGQLTVPQLAVVGLVALVLYGLFVTTQTLRHRDYFLPLDSRGNVVETTAGHNSPSPRATLTSAALLIVALFGVIGLAKVSAKPIEAARADAGLPAAVDGVVIATIVLMPECLAALRAARRGLVQTSLNLALGSAIAAIGLTIPIVAFASSWMTDGLLLALEPAQMTLFVAAMFTTALTVVSGRTTLLNAGLHLGLFSVFLLLTFAP